MSLFVTVVRRSVVVALFGLLLAPSLNASWEPSRGPEGAVVLSLANLGGTVYAGTTAGVYRSYDAGLTWQLTDRRLNDSVRSLLAWGTVLFAAAQDGLFRSDDGGDTWILLNSPEDQTALSLATDGAHLFAGSLNTVWRSDDLGLTWSFSTALRGAPVGGIAFQRDAVYAGVQRTSFPATGGVFKSLDRGTTWSQQLQGTGISALLSSADVVLAGGEGLFRSTDAGATWFSSGLRNENIRTLADFGDAIVAGTQVGVFKSVDGGVTWSRMALSADTWALNRTNGVIFAGAGQGVFTSTDGGSSWALRKSGVVNTEIDSVFSYLGEIFAFDVYNKRLYASSDEGRSWSTAGSGLGDFVLPGVTQGDAIYLGTHETGVYRSLDKGQSWVNVSSGLTSSSDREVIALGSSKSALILSTWGGIFRSTDGGGSWVRGGSEIHDRITSFLSDGGTIYAGSQSTIYRSDDEGVSWTALPLSPDTYFYRLISVFQGKLLALGSEALLFSRDRGASWGRVPSPVLEYTSSVVPVDGAIYTATLANIYVTFDEGQSWQTANDGLFRTFLSGALAASNHRLYAGVRGYGVQAMTVRPRIERLPIGPRPSHLIERPRLSPF